MEEGQSQMMKKKILCQRHQDPKDAKKGKEPMTLRTKIDSNDVNSTPREIGST